MLFTETSSGCLLLNFQSLIERVSGKLVHNFENEFQACTLWFHVQDQILEALRKEYWRRPGYPSELSGSDARKEASYREGKILKYYKVKNR